MDKVVRHFRRQWRKSEKITQQFDLIRAIMPRLNAQDKLDIDRMAWEALSDVAVEAINRLENPTRPPWWGKIVCAADIPDDEEE